MVAIDTDVLLLTFAFHRDHRQTPNQEFLAAVQGNAPVVTIYSVMELLGQLSFNLPSEQLQQWPSWLQNRYGLAVIYPETAGLAAALFFHQEFVERPLSRMQRHGIPYLDGLILELAEQTTGVRTLVTWNARHYRGKSHLTVLTPLEYLTT